MGTPQGRPLTIHAGGLALAHADEDVSRASARCRRVASKVRALLEELGLDLSDPNLAGTDLRVARGYEELFAGLYEGMEPRLRTFPNTEKYSEMVALVDIPFYSMCAHHLLPFFGSAHVAYLPRERIVGLSKLSRLVDFYARRPQVQERMTEQILALLEKRLRPAGAMVILEARHLCMEMRGVNKPGVSTRTSALSGVFEEERVRQELLALLPR